MKLLKPVQPNFIKTLVIATIGTFSFSAFAAHHGETLENASKATQESTEIAVEDMVGKVERDLTIDELKIKMDDEKAKAEMKKMMAKDSDIKPENH